MDFIYLFGFCDLKKRIECIDAKRGVLMGFRILLFFPCNQM